MSSEEKIKTLENEIENINRALMILRNKIESSSPGALQMKCKKDAVMLIKKRKMKETQLTSMLEQQVALEAVKIQRENMEAAEMHLKYLEGQKKKMKQYTKKMKSVEDLRRELEDLNEAAGEIQEISTRLYNAPDDEELLKELEEQEVDLSDTEAWKPGEDLAAPKGEYIIPIKRVPRNANKVPAEEPP